VACLEKKRSVCCILVRKSEGKVILKDLGIDGRILLKWNSRHRMGVCALSLSSADS
jgi:hypothetical protein